MAFQEVPDVAEFRVLGFANGTAIEVVNTIYVRNTVVGWAGVNLDNTATAIGDAWRDEMCPLLSDSYTFDAVEGRDLGDEFGATDRIEYNTVGGIVGTPLSASACMYAKLNGTGGSAPKRGGLFLSPFSEATITVDVWVAARVAEVQAAIDAVYAAADGAQVSNAVVIVSRYSKSANPTPPHKRTVAVSNTIASVVVSDALAIQRDRRLGKGT